MLGQMTLEELVDLRNKLDEIINMEDNKEEIATQHVDGIGDVDVDYRPKMNKKAIIRDIISRIKSSEIITERNFEKIGLGTAFYGRFLKDDEGKFGELERFIVVGSKAYTNNPEYISKDSPLGQAVMGKKDNEIVTYNVKDESGINRSIVFYIDEIDRVNSNYINNANVERAR